MVTFPQGRATASSKLTAMKKPPVFVVGAPRSGTTLLRNMLNRHPRLAILFETQFYNHVYTRRRAFGDLGAPAARRRFVTEYLATQRIRKSGLDLNGLQERLLRDATSYPALFASLMEHFAAAQGKSRWGEKSPQHSLFTETLCEWFPGAAIIHLVRDPREVVASLQLVPWASNSVITNAITWRRYNQAARRSSHRPEYLMVHYHDLVNHPERELRRICSLLGEEYSAAMLVPEEAAPQSPQSQLIRAPTTAERLGKWREQLTDEDVAIVEWTVGSDLASFGYTKVAAKPPVRTIARALAYAAFDAVRRRVAYFPALLYRVLAPTRISREEFWVYRPVRAAEDKAAGGAGSRQD
jgi:hypothetical protein